MQMRVGAIILCRYSSTRLPGKILLEINGKPVLQYIHERVAIVGGLDEIVVATSREASDDSIAAYCERHGFACFRGDLENVAQRLLDCALEYELEYVVRITGDSLFTSPLVLNQMLPPTRSGAYDVLTNRIPRTFPVGMSVDILRVPFYQAVISRFTRPDHFEHVTNYLYENPTVGTRFYFTNTFCPEAAGVQMAIDSAADVEMACGLLNRITRAHTEYDLCDWVRMM
jgi:spore coat polysaccharide biosynthesis protein SpsF